MNYLNTNFAKAEQASVNAEEVLAQDIVRNDTKLAAVLAGVCGVQDAFTPKEITLKDGKKVKVYSLKTDAAARIMEVLKTKFQ